MPLSPGDKLGPYEILALVGKGGMGEVYRAHDERLRRDVAIKVSSSQFSERFTREARTIASLNHTNIAHLYDVGPNYLVMEFVEGADLKGPLDFDDALPIIQQLIDGIEAAHEKNIIHRDLKPANIKITPEGVVKILDFGLAKAMEPPPSHDADPGNSPTLTMGATVAGTILGTAAYMAPEQAKGKQADKRSDIWSFGVVVYEMLTGKRLFQGESAVEILGGVLNKDADISAAPTRVHKVLQWCLEKDRKQRLSSISDARRLLIESGTGSPAQAASLPSRLPWLAAGALALALIGLGAWTYTRPTAAVATTRTSITVPANRPVSTAGSPTRHLAISPDGTQLVYVGLDPDAPVDRPGGQEQLQLRSLASLEVRDLPGTAGARQPFFSPDGQWVAFFTVTGELKKISLAGGSPITLAEKINGSQWTFGVWTEDNTIVGDRFYRMSAEGSASTLITTVSPGDISGYQPVLVPSSRAVLFSNGRLLPRTPIEAVMLDSGKRSVVLENAAALSVLSSRHLVFQRDGNILIAPFDVTKLTVTGPAVSLIDKIRQNTGTIPVLEMAVSRSGTLAYLPAADTAGALGMVSRDGTFQPLGLPPSNFDRPRVSPDGRSIAYMVGSGQKSDVHVYDLQRGSTTKLTQDSQDQGIAWHPDSRSLGIFSRRKDAIGIFLREPNGNERLLAPLPMGASSLRNFSWVPDGKQLAYTVQAGSQHDIWVLTVGDKTPGDKPTGQPFLNSAASEYSPTFSPDGRWLAYVSDESGRPEVYVRGYPQGERLAVSTGGGDGPAWRRDGKELYFQGAVDGVPKMMAVAVTPDGASLRLGKPVPLFNLRVTGPTGVVQQYASGGNGGVGYDVLPDGRFVMVRGPDPTSTREIVVVQNWFEELKRLVPGK
jgi:serine/threonine-protein kinase